MLAMFNVTFLSDFGYPETTHFIDPMEQSYRAKPIKSNEYVSTTEWGNGEFSEQGVHDKVDWFVSLDAYTHAKDIELALEEYWGRNSLLHAAVGTLTLTSIASTLVTVVTTSARATNTKG